MRTVLAVSPPELLAGAALLILGTVASAAVAVWGLSNLDWHGPAINIVANLALSLPFLAIVGPGLYRAGRWIVRSFP